MDLATAYLNPSPQLNTHANRLPDIFNRPTRNPDPCPVPDQPRPRSSNGKPWSLDRRLTSADRSAIVSEYQAGELQKTLAKKYGISISSVKRLARDARRDPVRSQPGRSEE
ncbi:hypothetical protein GCM10029992_12370 [Glycomyces albus]